jgi:hypothetical protein
MGARRMRFTMVDSFLREKNLAIGLWKLSYAELSGRPAEPIEPSRRAEHVERHRGRALLPDNTGEDGVYDLAMADQGDALNIAQVEVVVARRPVLPQFIALLHLGKKSAPVAVIAAERKPAVHVSGLDLGGRQPLHEGVVYSALLCQRGPRGEYDSAACSGAIKASARAVVASLRMVCDRFILLPSVPLTGGPVSRTARTPMRQLQYAVTVILNGQSG